MVGKTKNYSPNGSLMVIKDHKQKKQTQGFHFFTINITLFKNHLKVKTHHWLSSNFLRKSMPFRGRKLSPLEKHIFLEGGGVMGNDRWGHSTSPSPAPKNFQEFAWLLWSCDSKFCCLVPKLCICTTRGVERTNGEMAPFNFAAVLKQHVFWTKMDTGLQSLLETEPFLNKIHSFSTQKIFTNHQRHAGLIQQLLIRVLKGLEGDPLGFPWNLGQVLNAFPQSKNQ